MLVRSGGKGFPLLLENYSSFVSASSLVAAVQRAVGTSTLLYTFDGREKNEATEAEVEEWLSRWKRGEETRILLTDQSISRGWEAKELLVIGRSCTENLVMRSCGFCYLIKIE